MQRGHDLLPAHVERAFIVLFGQADQHFVGGRGSAVVLDLGILNAGRIHRLADRADIGPLLELDLHFGAAAEVHAQRTGLPMVFQCQAIEMRPATLKMREKARKYHFLPSQSMFTPRKNST